MSQVEEDFAPHSEASSETSLLAHMVTLAARDGKRAKLIGIIERGVKESAERARVKAINAMEQYLAAMDADSSREKQGRAAIDQMRLALHRMRTRGE